MSDTVVIGSTKPNPVQLPVPGSLLTKWNGAMALFHGALTAVTLAVGNLDLRVPVYASEISLDVGDSNSTSEWRLVPGVATRSGWMYLTYLTASFFFLSCVFHTGNVLLWRAPYQRALAGGFAPFRWAEYSLSASVMVLILSYTSGTIELYLLVLLFGLTFVTMLFGHLHEVICRPESLDLWEGRPLYRLQAHFFGYVPQLFAWGIILAQFFKAGGASTTDAAGNERQMPAFVYGIVFGELLLFWSFGVVQLVVSLRPPSKYYQGEIAYMWLSLLAKGVLGIVVLSNVLILGSFAEIYED